jgi:hypothetical protein
VAADPTRRHSRPAAVRRRSCSSQVPRRSNRGARACGRQALAPYRASSGVGRWVAPKTRAPRRQPPCGTADDVPTACPIGSMPSMDYRSTTLVQPELIRTAAIRATNTVGPRNSSSLTVSLGPCYWATRYFRDLAAGRRRARTLDPTQAGRRRTRSLALQPESSP